MKKLFSNSRNKHELIKLLSYVFTEHGIEVPGDSKKPSPFLESCNFSIFYSNETNLVAKSLLSNSETVGKENIAIHHFHFALHALLDMTPIIVHTRLHPFLTKFFIMSLNIDLGMALTSSLMDSFTSVMVISFFANTLDFKYPHRKKFLIVQQFFQNFQILVKFPNFSKISKFW